MTMCNACETQITAKGDCMCTFGIPTESETTISITSEEETVYVTEPRKAMDIQVGGGHYKSMAIQPTEFIHRNGIGFCEGNIIKYVSRWRSKGGLEDLRKARHYIDMILEMEG